jgi:uncharacterized protein
MFVFIGLAILYVLILVVLYFYQEKLIFFPQKLSANFEYKFDGQFEEKWIYTSDNQKLNALFFSVPNSKGVILYLHGNAGTLESWGEIASNYTQLGFDLLIFDYRGFGKSTGNIFSENQMFDDAQKVYNLLKESYAEEKITILGYSIGTGMATYLAAKNKPCKLILLAPYFNLPDLMNSKFKLIPPFLLKYRFMSNEYIVDVKSPIIIFHGKTDNVINYHSSEKLYKLCKPGDKMYLLEGQSHIGIDDNAIFQKVVEKFLNNHN